MQAMPWRPLAASWSRLFATGALTALVACAPSASVPSRPTRLEAAPRQPAPSAARAVAAPSPPISSETPALADVRHLLNRCAFGPRPGEVERVARMGSERWLEEQLAGPEESPLLQAALVPHNAAFVPPAQLVDDWLGDGWEAETRTLRSCVRKPSSTTRNICGAWPPRS
jgi:hypothetical protein